jgi:hypothetical protein
MITIKQTPSWTDYCKHPEGSYRGTVRDDFGGWIEMYVYRDPDDFDNPHGCFRYGEEDFEYISPGNLIPLYSKYNPLPPTLEEHQKQTYAPMLNLIWRSGGLYADKNNISDK